MKIALIDDEREVTDKLTECLERFEVNHSVRFTIKSFHSPSEFLLCNESFDLICLDIKMPEMDGIELAHRIRERDEDVIIIFITNLAQYALRGYEVHAFDFFVKPITFSELEAKMKKVIKAVNSESNKCIIVKTNEGIVRINYSDLCYVEVMKHELILHTEKDAYKIRGTMSQIESALPKSFVRSANSFLVNLKFVKGATYDSVQVGNYTLPLTRTRRNSFMDSLARYMGGIK